MLSVYLETGNHGKLQIAEVYSPVIGQKLMEKLINKIGIKSDHYFMKHNGCLIEADTIVCNGDVSLEPKLCGGKGGFGSMLRAIGAQIEKTTNREACRDLSGRRLRDINEEKRLKAWIEKQSSRNEEVAERKKRKLEKLCAEPKHEFKDKTYEEQRSNMSETVAAAVEAGFALKRAAEQEVKKNVKKRKTILDLDDIDSDDLDSSDESSNEEEESEKQNTDESKSNPGNSSEEGKTNSASGSPKSVDDSCR